MTRHNDPLRDPSLVGCPDCDLVQRLPELAPGASARCPRCGNELWRHREDSLNRTLSLTIAAALFYVVANSVPMATNPASASRIAAVPEAGPSC